MFNIEINSIKECVVEIYRYIFPKTRASSELAEITTIMSARGNHLIIASGSYKLILKYMIPLDGDVGKPVEILIETKKLYNIVKNLKGEVKFDIKDNDKLVVKSGKKRFQVKSFDIGDKINIPDKITTLGKSTVNYSKYLKMLKEFPSKDFYAKEWLRRILFRKEDGKVYAIGTDGHKIAKVLCEGECSFDGDILLNPYTPLDEGVEYTVARAMGFDVFITDSKIVFQRSTQDVYPNINNYIDLEYKEFITFDRSKLYNSIKSAFGLLDGSDVFVRMEIDGNLKLRAKSIDNNVDEFIESIDLIKATKPIVVQFKHSIVKDAVDIIEEDEVKINFIENKKMWLFKNDKMVVGLMPMIM